MFACVVCDAMQMRARPTCLMWHVCSFSLIRQLIVHERVCTKSMYCLTRDSPTSEVLGKTCASVTPDPRWTAEHLSPVVYAQL